MYAEQGAIKKNNGSQLSPEKMTEFYVQSQSIGSLGQLFLVFDDCFYPLRQKCIQISKLQ